MSKLARLRWKAGLSRQDVARKLDLQDATIYRWEKTVPVVTGGGRYPLPKNAARLVKLYNCKPEALVAAIAENLVKDYLLQVEAYLVQIEAAIENEAADG